MELVFHPAFIALPGSCKVTDFERVRHRWHHTKGILYVGAVRPLCCWCQKSPNYCRLHLHSESGASISKQMAWEGTKRTKERGLYNSVHSFLFHMPCACGVMPCRLPFLAVSLREGQYILSHFPQSSQLVDQRPTAVSRTQMEPQPSPELT